MSRIAFLDFAVPRPMCLLAVMASVCGAGVMGGACTVKSSDSSATDGGPGTPDGGGVDSTTPDGATAGALGFTPSNVDLSGIDLSKVGDFVVDNNECTIDSNSNLASCGDGAQVLGFKIATQNDGSKVAVYVAKSMTILPGQNLTIQGTLPFVFIALETITISGTLNGNGRADVGIAGGPNVKTSRSKGAGPGGGGSGTPTAGGGGGSYCGVGGVGAAETGGSASPAAARYGTPEITPLAAGSSGGAGDVGSAGAGGGAIQLVAGKSITIETAGLIQVGAGGGGFGGISGQEANGGGSGGSILLESLAVTAAGKLAANGGGNSTPNANPAAGGKKGIGPSSGGDGSAAASVNGTAGSFTVGNAAGGGGGGAGRIRINTKSAQATLSGVLSPAASTPCATQGAVH